MAHKNLSCAKKEKNDEFCVQYGVIQKEMESVSEFDPDCQAVAEIQTLFLNVMKETR